MRDDALNLLAAPPPPFGENLCESQLPPSTYAPPPVDVAPLDYDEMMAEILRLEVKARQLRMEITRASNR